jgi:BirA family transcriptional regulator, biotin operon repressor / biotin---[acetyl-CoA-carboxylase] ligase
LIADRQVAGRGRLGRQWLDGMGNFMGSTVVAVQPNDPLPHSLALLAACALRRALAQSMPSADRLLIKWPNDILIDDAKLAGILLERIGGHIIIGIGVNLVAAPSVPDRKTTSLKAMGMSVARDAFAHTLTNIWPEYLNKWRQYGIGPVITEWLLHAHPAGTPIAISEGSQAGLTGQFDGLEPDGALRLRDKDGGLIIIHAGDIAIGSESKG